MKVLEPAAGARDQEAAHLVAVVVEDQRAPVAMLRLARIRVFVHGAAIEAGEGVRVAREMGRDPIEHHADARLVAAIDELSQAVGIAMPAGGREIAGGLVSPGIIERMLADRQQLDVREAETLHIWNQALGKLRIAQELPVSPALPGAEVHFVDRHRRMQPVAVRLALAIHSWSCHACAGGVVTIAAVAGRRSNCRPYGSVLR